ncbi:tRNA (adenosine(37)-N6)-threonylcarbamoyltransferase complex dimerization subunit type 1 TsaB [Oceanobacillus alkalisoli]|uniref:tRNA (adenosine(37)-N6)-threonylcarbamoyltransferase complex dimerization subunit type 1 TsaB n=1 Tax=Oceanobacillus alkalisoli TaxID=2925113 RepID=UPI001EF08472|nr:tRNA (adenosine(37)-N6)-threonylcarbamoyltransferase complex dimerization subunit type 1 TsaB [Oceanobacillus alkalisoli]MCF3943177.1 tRNA (adenosine(37)-N6)-threonylcarbamoyltransferase complex dimerization subunit type 1 TsaB [Oceanobacillus alkalisoli]MCG5105360.1 tRNA (adenosine(37)-N6)-threonylcarbamoyltransferase complex dimerization subunit type 1 TsaB [Oceanobacillus alkalisoli]
MNVLVIDTSNHVLGVAIMKNDQVIGQIMTNLTKNHSVRLMPAINQLMAEVGMDVEELDQIAVAKGPGSYTGVRIGLTTAKTLAWALGVPIVGVSSLEALSYQGRFFDGFVCPFFDARRGLVYTGVYEWKSGQLTNPVQDQNTLFVNVLKDLQAEGKPVLFLSPDIASFKELIMETLGDLAVMPEGPYHITNPAHLGLASLTRNPDNIHTLAPNYLRLAEAEANWLKNQKEKKSNG